MVKRTIIYSLIALFAAISALWLDFYLPSKHIVTITGTEVKRADANGLVTPKNPADGPTHDIYFLYTKKDNGDVFVYRNEDTRWGFPFYFKFNSADEQARAHSLETEANSKALISSYGWRFNIVDLFPNVLRVQPATADTSTWSFIRIFGYIVWAVVWSWIYSKAKNWLNKSRYSF